MGVGAEAGWCVGVGAEAGWCVAALEVLFGNSQLKVATGECWESVVG